MDFIRDNARVGLSAFFLLVVGVLIVLPSVGSLPSPWGLVLGMRVGVGLVAVAARAARAGLPVSTDGVTVRKVWSTRFVPRASIAGLDWTLSFAPNLGQCLVIRLESGEQIKVPSVRANTAWFGSGSTAEKGLEEREARMRRVFDGS